MIGRPNVHLRTTDSTNERARELAARGAPHGTIVTADEQTAGRGRQGRSWVAPPGAALLLSLVVRADPDALGRLPLAVPVAVCEACESVAPLRCRVKWPNDVWIDGRKAAGILIEGRPQEGWAVVGVGVNVRMAERDFPPELRETATSLALAGAVDASPGSLLAALLPRLEHWLAVDLPTVLEAWRERDALHGEEIRWNGGAGVAAGVDDSGALLVEVDGSTLALDAGEVHLGHL